MKHDILDLIDQDVMWITEKGEAVLIDDIGPAQRRAILSVLKLNIHNIQLGYIFAGSKNDGWLDALNMSNTEFYNSRKLVRKLNEPV